METVPTLLGRFRVRTTNQHHIRRAGTFRDRPVRVLRDAHERDTLLEELRDE